MEQRRIVQSTSATSLADILDRVLDKGIVIVGDIRIQLADVELLNIKIRLLISSVDKAREIGIRWWEEDPYLSPKARDKQIENEMKQLKAKIATLESKRGFNKKRKT